MKKKSTYSFFLLVIKMKVNARHLTVEDTRISVLGKPFANLPKVFPSLRERRRKKKTHPQKKQNLHSKNPQTPRKVSSFHLWSLKRPFTHKNQTIMFFSFPRNLSIVQVFLRATVLSAEFFVCFYFLNMATEG